MYHNVGYWLERTTYVGKSLKNIWLPYDLAER